MLILFLSNNDITDNLLQWLVQKEKVLIFKNKITIVDVEKYNPDYIISYNYKFIIKKDVIDYMAGKIINLHISYLPWNRGAHPNLWAFLENTPHGVTIHELDEGLDTGNILLQEEMHFNPKGETFETTYAKLHGKIQKLFIDNWDSLKTGEIMSYPPKNDGSIHTKKQFNDLNKILPISWDMNINKYVNNYRSVFS